MTPPNALDRFPVKRAIELQGHLFDSLTFNKVLDTILAQDGHFLITNVVIGAGKLDPSTVQMTVYGQSEEHLQTLLTALAPMHPNTLSGTSSLGKVTVDGLLPHGAAILGYLPVAVSVEAAGSLVASSQDHAALVLKKQGAGVVPVAQTELKVGDEVVVGAGGFVWHE